MPSFRLVLSYRGTRYHGWQAQPGADTVQGRLDAALARVSGSPDVRSLGAGRTDAGVHALAQSARADVPLDIDPAGLAGALNGRLPDDIRVLSAEPCPASFHPIRDHARKEYRYYVAFGRRPPGPHFQDVVAFVGGEPDVPRMREGAALFVGRHDFADFRRSGTETPTTVREIFEAGVRERAVDFPEELRFHEVRFVGDGFLRRMARLMVGAVVAMGLGRLDPETVRRSLESPRGRPPAPAAPARGLFLHSLALRRP